MKSISELKLGYKDAENYKRRENKEMFNQIFLRTPDLEKLCESHNYFLIGEKGTGKTAYAVYLSNTGYKDNLSSIKYLRETEYSKFVALKKAKQLTLSDYTNIWKVLIYLLMAQQVKDKEIGLTIEKFFRFRNLSNAIDAYYQNAFNPEIIYAMQFVEESSIAAKILSDFAKLGGEAKDTVTFTESRFQINLMYIQKEFEEAFSSLKLSQNHILFIDGIDIRPTGIDYDDYLDCIKGLANAVWSINTDFFGNIRDSKGRMRVVLLVRPDIFNSLGLQNQNSKLRDNSIVLTWNTTYREYRSSPLFLMVDKLLTYEQPKDLNAGQTWDYYFPFDAKNVISKQEFGSSFIIALRYSLYRPRDFMTILEVLRENVVEQKEGHSQLVFSETDFGNPAFTRKLSDYLIGEVKDQLMFYHSSEEYELFLKFFQFLDGKFLFSYQEYISSFEKFERFLKKNSIATPSFFTTPDNFLQFLYELNVVCYIVDTYNEPFFGWCFRDRTLSNIAPKVKTEARYEIHYGLRKALDLGRTLFQKGG